MIHAILHLLPESGLMVLLLGGMLVAGAAILDAMPTAEKFRRLHAGRIFLVAATRKGWREFILNNVIPILSPSIEVLWLRSPEGRVFCHGLETAGIKVQAPAIVQVNQDGIEVIDLHRHLLPIKNKPKANGAVQEEVRKRLRHAMVKENHMLIS